MEELTLGLWHWTAVHPDAGLPEVRTFVPGDRLLGTCDGAVRVCPDSWLRYLKGSVDGAQLRVLLAPLLDLPVERIRTWHGDPVLARGHEALRIALA